MKLRDRETVGLRNGLPRFDSAWFVFRLGRRDVYAANSIPARHSTVQPRTSGRAERGGRATAGSEQSFVPILPARGMLTDPGRLKADRGRAKIDSEIVS